MAGDVGALNAKLSLKLNEAEVAATIGKLQAKIGILEKKLSTALGKTATAATKQTTKAIEQTTKATSNWVWTATSGVKAISRVVYGILISQAFYRLIRMIQDATREIMNFSMELERAAIGFKYLIGEGQQAADNMIEALEDLAALTPYTYQTAQNAAQTLLALGFMPDQLIPVLRLMADLSAATGGESDQMEKLAYAMGKVRAMGKMTTRELRLFVSARIPIYQILREQLGLTEKDFEKLRITADKAIPAILRGIMKYKGAAEEMEMTTSGLLSSIRDYFLFTTKDMLQGIFESFRGILKRIRGFLQVLRETFKTEGFAGVINLLFPPEIRQTIIILIDSFKKLGIAVVDLIKAFGPTLRSTLEFFARMLTYILPPIVALIEFITQLAVKALRSSKFVKVLVSIIGTLWIATVVAGFVGILSKAIVGLGIAQGVSVMVTHLATAVRVLYVALSSHPIAAIITIIAGAIVYLAMSSEWGARMLDKLQGKIARFFGLQTAIDAVTTSTRDGINAYTDYEQSIEDIIDSFAGIGDEVEETDGKIKKFLMSFDEVYSIPEAAGGAGGGLLDFAFPELPKEPFGASGYWEDVVEETSKLKSIWEKLLNILKDIKWPWAIPFIIPKIPIPELDWQPALEWILKRLAELKALAKQWAVDLPQSIWDSVLEGLRGLVPDVDWGEVFDIDWSTVFDIDWGLVLDSIDWSTLGQSISEGIATALGAIDLTIIIDKIRTKLEDALGRAIDNLPAPVAELLSYAVRIATSFATALFRADWKTAALAIISGLAFALIKAPVYVLATVFATLFSKINWAATGEAIKSGIIKAFNAVTEWMKTQNSASWLVSLVNALAIALITGLALIFGPGVIEFFKGLGPLFSPVAEAMGTAAGGALGTGMIDEVDKLSNDMLQNFEDKEPEAEEAGKKVGGGASGGLKIGFEPSIKNTEGQMKLVYTAIEDKMIEATNNALGWAQDIFVNFINGIQSKMADIALVIIGIVNLISSIIYGMVLTAFNFGKNIVDSLASGIRSGVHAVTDAIRHVVDEAVRKVKEILGMSSPSKVFAEIGKNVGLGFAKGIDDSGAIIAKAMKSMPVSPIISEAATTSFRTVSAPERTIQASPINEDALRRLINEISGASTNEPARTPIYVGTLIADRQGLRELERKLYDVRVNEDRRKA